MGDDLCIRMNDELETVDVDYSFTNSCLKCGDDLCKAV